MNRWGSTHFLNNMDKVGSVTLTKQARFADWVADKVASAWIPPINFSALDSVMQLLHQKHLEHVRNVESALSTEAESDIVKLTLFEEKTWIAGYEQLIDFLGQGPDCLVRAHEQHLLIFQGRKYVESMFISNYRLFSGVVHS